MKRVVWFGLVIGLLIVLVIAYGLLGSPVKGKVIDRYSGKPISGARIQIGNKQTATDTHGRFYLKVDRGRKTLVITAKGYEEQTGRIIIPFLLPTDLGTIKLKNGIVVGKVVEAFPKTPPITKATVEIGRKKTAVGPDGTFKLTAIPVGEKTLSVKTSIKYEPYQRKIKIHGGINRLTIAITPTIEEVAKRYATAIKEQNWGLIYDLFHPDTQARKLGKERFVAEGAKVFQNMLEEGSVITDVVVHDPIHLSSWKPPGAEVIYHGVSKVPMVIKIGSPIAAFFGVTHIPVSAASYWLKTNGEWRLIFFE
jgi:hypothetical protein